MSSLKEKIKNILRPLIHKIENSVLSVPCYYLLDLCYLLRYISLGKTKIDEADRKNVEENVTFIYKSFNRHRMAKRVYRSIKTYYPNSKIIIADDSKKPLKIKGAHIIHLPFNSGLSKGLISALNEVKTEYVMRLDDDILLTPNSNIHKQLSFLQSHPEIDLSCIQVNTNPEEGAKKYLAIRMNRDIIIPAGVEIDGHIVAYKGANCFVARTGKVRKVGYDPNIRMFDHHEFFYRAAGVIVTVLDPHSFAFHWHNRFNRGYHKYRYDTAGDTAYLRVKYTLMSGNEKVPDQEAMNRIWESIKMGLDKE